MCAWHYIRGNKSTAKPASIVVLKTETVGEPVPESATDTIERFRLGAASYCRHEKGKATRHDSIQFMDTQLFWNWLSQYQHKTRPVWVFGHNIGYHAAQVGLLDKIESHEYRLAWPVGVIKRQKDGELKRTIRNGIVCLDDPPIIIECRHLNGCLLRIVDTLNYWRCGIPELATMVCDKQYTLPAIDDPDAYWLAYCQHDVEIIQKAILKFIAWHEEHDLGMFRYTVSGCAFGAWRHRFMPGGIVKHDETGVKRLERASYYGGQLGLYYIGKVVAPKNGQYTLLSADQRWGEEKPIGPTYKLDVTGLFPSVMRDNEYPTKLIDWKVCQDGKGPDKSELDYTCIARVLVDTGTNTYPLREHNRVIFPSGLFWTTLCGPELSQALALGEVNGVGSFARYVLSDIFSTYVDYFWQLRYMAQLSCNTIEANLCKVFLNSLYGKFGQRSAAWVNRPDIMPPIPWGTYHDFDAATKSLRHYRAIGWHTQEELERGEHRDAYPAIAAFVTAYARDRMAAYRGIAGKGNYYYQGIDSLFVSPAGYRRLDKAGCIRECTLGKLRVEEVAGSCSFTGYNNYDTGTRLVMSSMKANAIQQGNGTYQQCETDHLSSTIERGPKGGIRVRRVTRKMSSSVIAGTIDKHGWVSPPYRNHTLQDYSNPSASNNSPPTAASSIADCQEVAPELGKD